MNFAPEIVYPLYLSAASDRYSISEFCLKYIGIFMWIDKDATLSAPFDHLTPDKEVVQIRILLLVM